MYCSGGRHVLRTYFAYVKMHTLTGTMRQGQWDISELYSFLCTWQYPGLTFVKIILQQSCLHKLDPTLPWHSVMMHQTVYGNLWYLQMLALTFFINFTGLRQSRILLMIKFTRYIVCNNKADTHHHKVFNTNRAIIKNRYICNIRSRSVMASLPGNSFLDQQKQEKRRWKKSAQVD